MSLPPSPHHSGQEDPHLVALRAYIQAKDEETQDDEFSLSEGIDAKSIPVWVRLPKCIYEKIMIMIQDMRHK